MSVTGTNLPGNYDPNMFDPRPLSQAWGNNDFSYNMGQAATGLFGNVHGVNAICNRYCGDNMPAPWQDPTAPGNTWFYTLTNNPWLDPGSTGATGSTRARRSTRATRPNNNTPNNNNFNPALQYPNDLIITDPLNGYAGYPNTGLPTGGNNTLPWALRNTGSQPSFSQFGSPLNTPNLGGPFYNPQQFGGFNSPTGSFSPNIAGSIPFNTHPPQNSQQQFDPFSPQTLFNIVLNLDLAELFDL